jgi:hypothetical protein
VTSALAVRPLTIRLNLIIETLLVDLTLADPFYILPVVTASTIYLQLYFSADGLNTETMPPLMKKVAMAYRYRTSYQCCGSALVSLRILIQHFLSMRIRIRIQIQGFDDQKFEGKLQLEKNLNFFIKNAIYLFLCVHKGRPSYRRSLHSSRENFFTLALPGS